MARKKVTPAAILAAQHELTRLGVERAMARLERTEPALAEHLFEELSQLHQALMKLGAPAPHTQKVYLQTQRLLLLIAIIRVRG